jgi:hypothetical protein
MKEKTISSFFARVRKLMYRDRKKKNCSIETCTGRLENVSGVSFPLNRWKCQEVPVVVYICIIFTCSRDVMSMMSSYMPYALITLPTTFTLTHSTVFLCSKIKGIDSTVDL